MKHYNKRELNAKIKSFITKKSHEFPEIYRGDAKVESPGSLRPIEKHYATKQSHLFGSLRLGPQY